MKQLKQYSLFDYLEEKPKPYSYSFKRYIGQKVRATFTNEILTIKKIEPYYTICTDGKREYAGINVTIYPADENERGGA